MSPQMAAKLNDSIARVRNNWNQPLLDTCGGLTDDSHLTLSSSTLFGADECGHNSLHRTTSLDYLQRSSFTSVRAS
jgi:hypothetical protein